MHSQNICMCVNATCSASFVTLLVNKFVRLMLDIFRLFSLYKCGTGRENNFFCRLIMSILLPEAKKITLIIYSAFYIVNHNYLKRKVIIQSLMAISYLIHYKPGGLG